jgi:hypothetical protein
VAKNKSGPTVVRKRHTIFLQLMRMYGRIKNASHIGIMNTSQTSNPGGRNAAKPTQVDFIIEVDLALGKLALRDQILLKLVYGSNVFDDELQTELFAERVFHGRQSSLCAGAGALFERRGLTTSYFDAMRQVPAGLRTQTVLDRRPVPKPLMTEKEVRAKYAALRAKQFAVHVPEPEIVVQEPMIETETEVELFESERHQEPFRLNMLDDIEETQEHEEHHSFARQEFAFAD